MAGEQAHSGRSYRLSVAGLVLLLTVIVFANSWGVFTADIKPEVYLAPGPMVSDYLSAWTFSPYLGGPNFNAGLAPVVAFLSVLRGMGLSPELAYKTFHLVLWLVAASGMVRLVRRLDPGAGRLVGLIAGIAYIANPYAVSAGATLAILLPMAVLPWQLLTLLRAFQQPRSWRWPALFGLTFFLMSGMNAGVVPVLGLLAVVPMAIYARREFGVPWRAIAGVTTKCGVFVVWLSLYWLVPSIGAVSTGVGVVENSETASSIANVSSFSEALRGLGLWPLYGADGSGPWQPGMAMYLTATVIVLATFIMSSLSIVALSHVRRPLAKLLASLIAMAIVVMVGMYPFGAPSPFGRALGATFDAVPALAAFRTTNKIGAVLVLGCALAVALALGDRLRRWDTGPRGRAALLGACGILAVLVSFPAWSGQLYGSEVDIPRYWKTAADRIDDAPPDRRILALPGQVQSSYRWSQSRPDDVFNSLFSRDVVIPITTPSTSATAFNFGAALDDTFQSGVRSGAATSTFARYLGADAVLLRHDVNWEDNGGARPSQTQQTVNADNGLTPVRNFGRPGQNVGSPTVPPDGITETDVPPLQLYGVDNAQSMVRAEPATSSLVVAGDGWSVPSMERRGLLDQAPSFRYAQDLTATDWERTRSTTRRLVLTDSNRRRDSIPNRLTNGQGPLLAADDQLPATSRTLGVEARDQTVLTVDGGRAKATQSGFAFFDVPWAVPDNAFDNNPKTAWIFGDFKKGTGQTLSLDLDAARPIGDVTITQADRGPARISSITVTAGDRTQTATFDAEGVATVDLGNVIASDVTFSVGRIVGAGFNAVGIQDVAIAGVDLTRVARTPQTFDRAYDAMTARGRAQFRTTPLDVLFARAQGTAESGDDEEVSLERDFSIPDARRFTARAAVRVDDNREELFDRLAGIPAGATSSSRIFDNPDVRASQAFDDDRTTAWIPGGASVAGSWVQIDGPERELPTLTFDQRALADSGLTAWATRVTISADGVAIATADVKPGRNSIDLTTDGEAPTVGTVRVTIDSSADRAGSTSSPPRIVEIGAGRILAVDKDADRCVGVADIDGKLLRMRPIKAPTSDGSAWRRCGPALVLARGKHQVRSVDPGVTLDSLELRDRQRVTATASPVAPTLTVDRGFGASMTASVQENPSGSPYFLTIGQAHDPRWRASVGGTDLGPPLVVDGYAAGWLITSRSAQVVHITYQPQQETNAAIAISAVGLVVVGALAPGAGLRRRVGVLDRGLTAAARLRRRLVVRILQGLAVVRRRSPRVHSPSFSAFLRPRTGFVVRVPVALARTLRWGALLLGAWVLTSWPGVVAVVLLAAWHVIGTPTSRQLIVTGAGLVGFAGLVFIAGMGENRGMVTSALVTGNRWPNVVTVCGLVFAMAGVWRFDNTSMPEELRGTPPASPRSPEVNERTVTIVVPTKDNERTIERCLQSVRAQDISGVELIVVDNASSDRTVQIAETYADLVIVSGPERSAQRNAGFAAAAGTWVVWLDSDIYLTPDAIRIALDTARAEGADGVALPERTIGEGFWTRCRALERECYLDVAELHNPRMLRREFMVGTGAFDTRMSGPEDANLRLAMHRDGAAIALAPVIIDHDEGRLTLPTIFQKRVYYGRSLPVLVDEHPAAVSNQFTLLVRAYAVNWRLLVRHPILTAALVPMRLMEAAGYLVGARRRRRSDR